MDSKLHEHIHALKKKLEFLVKDCGTEQVLGTIATHLITGKREIDKSALLVSPSRQVQFLIGILMGTLEPQNPKDFTKDIWLQSINILNDLFNSYAQMYWPSEEEFPNINEKWRESRQTSMPAFLHYFNTGILATVEQVAHRVSHYLSPFDNELKSTHGISATEAIKVSEWIADYLQQHMDSFLEISQREKKHRIKFLDHVQEKGWDISTAREEVQKTELPALFKSLGLQELYKVPFNALKNEFGEELATLYWNLFTLNRGEIKAPTYITEKNPITIKPLYLISEGFALCPLGNALYWAVLNYFEDYLSSYPDRERYFRYRDKELEREGRRILQRIFPSDTTFLPGVFETPDLQYEHDLVILHNDVVIILEAKASPPTEPFRDPDRAFVRLKHFFRSDKGIQKAFDQGNRIVQKLQNGHDVPLYNSDGTLIQTLKHSDISSKIIICLTKDDFGPLAVDLSLLLEIDSTQEYPWAVNVLDLDSIVNAYEYFKWGADKLIKFIKDRISLQGKLIAFDELDIVGSTLKHGDLSQLATKSPNRYYFDPKYTDIFDKIETAKKGGEPVEFAPTKPFISDYSKMLKEMVDEVSSPHLGTINVKSNVGRNNPCPCGSGKKYKKCCGR